jgi:hypothetical protein
MQDINQEKINKANNQEDSRNDFQSNSELNIFNKELDSKKNEKSIKLAKPNALERFIINNTPQKVKDCLNKIIDKLPPRLSRWIKSNRFLTICIIYSFRGLFLRPSMWAVYAGIASYFHFR